MHNYQKTLKEEMKSICFLIGDISYRGGAERITLSVASKLAIKNKVTILSIAEFKVEDLIFDIQGKLHVFYSPYELEQFDDVFSRRLSEMTA